MTFCLAASSQYSYAILSKSSLVLGRREEGGGREGKEGERGEEGGKGGREEGGGGREGKERGGRREEEIEEGSLLECFVQLCCKNIIFKVYGACITQLHNSTPLANRPIFSAGTHLLVWSASM